MTRIFIHRARFEDDTAFARMEAWLDRHGANFTATLVEEGRSVLGVLFRIPTRALALQFRDLFA